MVGANAYLMPPNASQGFAPHYDDIEAFCLQLEGRKRWKVYPPPPNFNCPVPVRQTLRFTTQDLQAMDLTPIMDIVLNEGDLCYNPRGWIHQACTLNAKMDVYDSPNHHHQHHPQHSLHLTVSAMQQWAWVDLMEWVMPEALDAVTKSETPTVLRQG
jgi:bifunctional lysine-specific demethylase and histidyl-hydroxylase NO66